ncbi:hypothetical protein ABPG74_016984 [Tetrahymena malaccensis]
MRGFEKLSKRNKIVKQENFVSYIQNFYQYKVSNVEQLKDQNRIIIKIFEQCKQEFLNLISQIKNMDNIKQIQIFQYKPVNSAKLFTILQQNIQTFSNLNTFETEFQRKFSIRFEEAKLLSMSFKSSIQYLVIKFGQIDQISYLQIINGFKNLRDLLEINLKINYTNQLDINDVYISISAFKNLRKLQLLINTQYINYERQQNLCLTECEYIETSLLEFNQINSLKQAQKLSSLNLIFNFVDKDLFNRFINHHLNYITDISNLELQIELFDQQTKEFLIFVIQQLRSLKKVIIFMSTIEIDLQSLFQIIELNSQINTFGLFLYENPIIVKETPQIKLSNLKNLSIECDLNKQEDEFNFIKQLKAIDNLYTLELMSFENKVKIFKLKRLVKVTYLSI